MSKGHHVPHGNQRDFIAHFFSKRMARIPHSKTQYTLDGHLLVHLISAMKSLLKALAVVFPSKKYHFRVEHPPVVYHRARPVWRMYLWISGPSYVHINRLLFLRECFGIVTFIAVITWYVYYSFQFFHDLFCLLIFFFFIFCFFQMHSLLSCLLSAPAFMDYKTFLDKSRVVKTNGVNVLLHYR